MYRQQAPLSEALYRIFQAKVDASIKEQRDAYKASRASTPDLPNSSLGVRKPAPEPTIKIVAAHPAVTATLTPPGAKKIFISREGKIIGHQMAVSALPTPPGKVT